LYRNGCGETQRAEPEKIATAALHYGNFQRAKLTIANGELIHLVDLNELNFVVGKTRAYLPNMAYTGSLFDRGEGFLIHRDETCARIEHEVRTVSGSRG
jgi:hypothetical protein